MRKKNLKLLALSSLFGLTMVVGSSLAWFAGTANVGPGGQNLPIESSSQSGYFAYGDGTSEANAYGIKTPRQLYNLAWLQYLGLIGLDSQQLYFELADNIDMTGWVLPPIGTETYPFIGCFDGQGYVISNLTVSNNFSDYGSVHPTVINSWGSSSNLQPHILGVFGVVGNYNGDVTDYNSSINKLIDTGIYNATIKTSVSDSLMGIAAGYVSADLKNIVVDKSTISIEDTLTNTTSYGGYTSNISDYSLVGYTTKKKTISRASQTAYAVNVDSGITFNATEDGNANGWGGSVDMKSVLNRLQTIRDSYSTSSNYAFKQTIDHHANGTNDNPVPTYQTGSNVRLVVDDANHKEWGHFNFAYDNSTLQTNYAQLGGGHLRQDNYYEFTEHNAFQITNGTQYLRVVSTTIESTTAQSGGSYWTLSSDSQLYTKNGNTWYYLRNNNGSLEVVTSTANASTWVIDDSGSNRVISNGNYCITYNGSAFVLSSGTLTGNVVNPYYVKYYNGNYYLSNNGTTVGNSNTAIKKWYFSSLTGTTSIYTYIDGTIYYLKRNSSALQLATGQNGNYTWTWGTNGNYLTLSMNGNSNTYYIRGYQGNWQLSTSSNNSDRRRLSIEGTEECIFTSNLNKTARNGIVAGPDEEWSDTTYNMDYSGDDVSYFPLNTVNDTNNFNPSDNNTAYLTAGYYIPDNATANGFTSAYTMVRFSKNYSISGNISKDFTASSGKFSHIYTVNDNMQSEDIINQVSDYNRLNDAMTSLGNVLKTSNNSSGKTYGVHFMDAAISMEAITTAKYVGVNGTSYTNYELPVNSIDFNLKEFGYINFIAGTYFDSTAEGRNNSFFALYQIERLSSNPNKINRILEIESVYQHKDKPKTYSYVYKLTDGTSTFYTKPYRVTNSEGGKQFLDGTDYAPNTYLTSKPSDYTLTVFNTARIKKNSIASDTFDNHVYYFEIPMNDGEFCLGSVEGGVGSYLMYLDIGANAAKTQRTIFYEKFTLQETTYSYPLGIALQGLNASYASGVVAIDVSQTVDASDSACLVIKTGYVGVVTIDRNGNDVALNRSQAANAPPNYAGESITLIHEVNSSVAVDVVPVSSMKYETTRMQFYDYMINTESLVVTEITDTKTTNMITNVSTTSRTIVQSKYSGHLVDANNLTAQYFYDSANNKDDRDSMKIYHSDTGVRYTSDEIISTTSLPIPSSKLSSTVILNITMTLEDVDSYTDTITLVAAVDPSTGTDLYYVFSQYLIEITPTSGSITVKVISTDTGKTIYIGEVKVTGNNQVIEIDAP